MVGRGEDDYKRTLGELLRVMELFFILKLIIHCSVCQNTQNCILKMVHFTVYKLYLNKSDLKI